jgi:hypothetical protein
MEYTLRAINPNWNEGMKAQLAKSWATEAEATAYIDEYRRHLAEMATGDWTITVEHV